MSVQSNLEENQKRKITLLEKYFPKTLEEVQLPASIKLELQKKTEQVGYRLLFYSTPGTGKTSTARVLASGSNKEVMYLSGSNDFNVEVYRNKILPFASGFSVLNKQKFIIIDEAENIRDNLQDAFKIVLDQCTKVNFIFITNEVEKMNGAILSRCAKFDYNFVGDNLIEQKKNYLFFIKNICEKEKIKYETSGLSTIMKTTFPDFRNTLVQLEQIQDTGLSLTEDNINRFSDVGKQMIDLYDLVENPAIGGKEFYTEISKFKGKEKDCLLSLGEPFFIYLNNKNLHDKTIDVALILSRYYDQFLNSMNKFVTFTACVVEIKTLFR